jgi:predicted nucleic acid-binding protein
MIAADTSSLIAYFSGENTRDTMLIDEAINDGVLVLPPPVLLEILSDPNLPSQLEKSILEMPLISDHKKVWQNAGKMRATFIKQKRKARLADSLIASYCIIAKIPLITRDNDFQKYSDNFQLIILT